VQAQLIGFSSTPVPVQVQPGQTVQVTLAVREEAIALDEVVVTGVGAAARRREIGNSLAQINVEEASVKPVQNIENLLRGATTGVSGLAVSGQVGGSGTLMLRGVNSVSQGNEPLIYVDGVRLATSRIPPANLEDGRGPRVSGMALNEINMDDVERIEVIKGAAATTLYGTEASGGVIQIFTKRGTTGRPQWSFSTSQGVNFWPELSETIRSHDTWLGLKQVQREGHVQRYDASVRGGNEGMQYYISASADDEEGIVDTQGSKNWGATGNFTVELMKGVTVNWNTAYSNRQTRYVPDSNNRHGYLLNAMRMEKGYYPGNTDPSWTLETELLGEVDNFVSGLQMQHVAGPLRNTLRVGMHHIDAVNSGLLPFGYYLYEPGSIGVQRWRNRTLSAEYTGTLEHSFGENVRSTLTLGGQVFDESRRAVEASGLDFSGPGRVTVSSAAKTFSSEDYIREINAGFFVQETVGLQDRLFLIGGLRVDGSSTFGEDYGLQYYPKLSASWVLSDYAFWPSAWFNSMRLRAAVGEAGKAPGAFDAVRTWNPIAGLEGQPGVSPQNLGDPNLGPERTREYELGFDASLLDARVGLEMTYYHATTRNALFPVIPIPSQGFAGSQVSNVGELQSRGVEFSADLLAVQTDRLTWALGVDVTTNKGEVSSMGGAAPVSMGYEQFVREGFAAPSFFGRKLLNPDEIADPEFERGAFLGQTLPDLTTGLNTSLTIGESLTLSALGELSRGGHVLNATAYLNTIREIWPACMPAQQRAKSEGVGVLTAYERARCVRKFNGYDQFVEEGDFFKLREVSASYRVPARWLPESVGSASFAISGANLLTITDFTGMDPEVIDSGSSGTENFRRVDYYNFPPRRAVTTKLSITF
jgi:TonB-dependent SusC/RagA subfamily outer membrane receptor